MPVAKKRVVVIGGGTGTYQVLVGLKKFPNLELAAVVAMSDSGGSTGRLREEFGMFPPGDLRRALLALSSLPIREKTLGRLFDFRFENGKELQGHSLGNIFLAALTQITGSPEKAIKEAEKILAVSGRVLPVTLTNTDLVATLVDGTKIFGETNIDIREIKPDVAIDRVFLKPKVKVYPEASEAIEKADLVILGPGDLYTSVVPNLLVNGLTDAIKSSKGKVAFVINLMTKHGETDGFTVSKFVGEIKKYLGGAANKLNYVVVNNAEISGKTLAWYEKSKAEPVLNDMKGNGIRVVEGNFLDKANGTVHFVRHDPVKLAQTLVKLL